VDENVALKPVRLLFLPERNTHPVRRAHACQIQAGEPAGVDATT